MRLFGSKVAARRHGVGSLTPPRCGLPARGLVLALLVLLAFAAHAPAAQASPQYAALVLDAQTGRILHATNIDTRVHPASLTKIMTLYMVFDALNSGRLTMDQQIPISARAAAQPPSKIGLAAGQTISVRDAIMVLITKSANDIAVAVAEALAGSEAEFGRQMTALAQSRLDMPNTVFTNASGLPDSRQITTARDMVNLAIRMRAHFPEYYPLFSTRNYSFHGTTHRNHNGLLGEYQGLDGIKTGFINASGFNLVASAERDGRRIFGVIFGGSSAQARNARMAALLDAGFAAVGYGPERPAFPPIARGGGPAPAYVVAAAPTLSVAAAAASTAATLPDRPAFAPPVRSDVPTIYAVAATEAAGQAPDAPVAHNVPASILLEALDPARITATAATSPVAEPGCADGWAVQIGAFGEASIARAIAAGVRDRGFAPLAGSSVLVAEADGVGQTLYRALLAGLSDQSAADTACVVLQIEGIACTPVTLDGTA
ncbi:MAG: serine hydrolase, partial [Alphaproteobacteria bacterium]